MILNTGSLNARLPEPLVLDHSAAKAALVNMAKALSKEVGSHGIRVVTVDPGPVATNLWLGDKGVAKVVAGATGQTPDDIAAGAAAGMVTGRFTRPEEVANLLVMLASDRVGNMTGTDVVIDGGMVTTL
jgi:NAD(P)-dependent dehydrogenase (short-subunit alcohol dehydrogenase family)